MANQLPEVLPLVNSMPTTGWFCQTGGKARRRTTKNTSTVDTQGIYDVKGVPGFTHNSSAVVSVDADYTQYRESAISVDANVWNVGALDLPVGLLTDSAEPDNADERYDRAIEKCVGNISLFPENCTGHINEPARSISEIRTLVAPKVRLETLTYIDELGGWRVPVDANDTGRTCATLISEFPDVIISVLPRDQVAAATLNMGVNPSSLYIDAPGASRFIVNQSAIVGGLSSGSIGWYADKYRIWQAAVTASDGTPAALRLIASTKAAAEWDNCITFAWDPDKRTYRSRKELTIVLESVHGVEKADGVTAVPNTVFNATAQPRLIITFPILETSAAFDGYCWLSNLNNEDALAFVKRQTGAAIAPQIIVNVMGSTGVPGPFRWVGMPALRIPVGGRFAFPGPDIMTEQFGDGSATDLQYNFYDKFKAFTPRGLMQYHYKYQSAEIAHTGLANAANASKRSAVALNFELRQGYKNSGMFNIRPGGFQKHLSDKQRHTNFFTAATSPYLFLGGVNVGPTTAHIKTGGIRNVMYKFVDPDLQETLAQTAEGVTQALRDGTRDALLETRRTIDRISVFGNTTEVSVQKDRRDRLIILLEGMEKELVTNAAITALAEAQAADDALIYPLLLDANGYLSKASVFGTHQDGIETNFAGSTTFQFRVADGFAAGNVVAAASHNFARVPCTPMFFECEADIVHAGLPGGLRLFRNQCNEHEALFLKNATCIMDVSNVQGDMITCDYDFTETLSDARGQRSVALAGAEADGNRFFAGGYSFMLAESEEKTNSNMTIDYYGDPNYLIGGGTFADEQAMRKEFGDNFQFGNKFEIPKTSLITVTETILGIDYIGSLHLKDVLFATSKKLKGIIFVTQPANAGDRTHMFMVLNPNTSARIHYVSAHATEPPINQTVAANTKSMVVLGKPQTVIATQGQLVDMLLATFTNAGANLDMYLINDDFVEATDVFGSGPFEDDEALVQSKGAVFQSIKRISQHACGPILNPNARIGASAPLNYDSRHLPPELRDFRLRFTDIDWGRLQATKTTLNELSLYEFNDGIQRVGAQTNVMYLPQFREFKSTVAANVFDVEIFSELGAPSYFCLFCRYESTDILQQPQIRSLSIFNLTTKRKSNVLSDLDITQLYHLTQRNVHPGAQYDKHAFKRRQTVLLKTEDVGMLGLSANEYQKAKRVKYKFSGTTDEPGQLYIVMVYNNRGLNIDGRRLQVVTLHS